MSNPNIKDYAKKGGRARWLPRATHQGLLKIMGKELPCVVLEDGRRIITQASIFKAFDRPARGSRSKTEDGVKIPAFLDSKNLKPYMNDQISEVITPIQYRGLNKAECSGFRAEVIPTVCEMYLNAQRDGTLTSNQATMAKISDLLIRSLATVGIIGLIDEATGYQQVRPRDALEAYLNKILSKELARWCKRFPDEYYENIYKLRKWPAFSPSMNKYSCVGHYTNDIIYLRLGKDVLDELKNKTPDTSKISMHQWLSVDIGHSLLSNHMQGILTLQRLALAEGWGWVKFMTLVDKTFPKKIHALEGMEESTSRFEI